MEGLGKALPPCAGKALPASPPSPQRLWGDLWLLHPTRLGNGRRAAGILF